MKTMVLSFIVMLVGVFGFSVSQSAAEMESSPPKCAIRSFAKEYEFSKAVFVGKVVKIEKDGNERIFHFKVQKFWKGVKGKTVMVSVSERARYQAQFELDGEYLVFAKSNEYGKFWDGRCSRSRDLEGYGGAVEEDLKKLGNAKTCISLDE